MTKSADIRRTWRGKGGRRCGRCCCLAVALALSTVAERLLQCRAGIARKGTIRIVGFCKQFLLVLHICLFLTRGTSCICHDAELVRTDILVRNQVRLPPRRSVHGEFVQRSTMRSKLFGNRIRRQCYFWQIRVGVRIHLGCKRRIGIQRSENRQR